jgi:hypothetical protein
VIRFIDRSVTERRNRQCQPLQQENADAVEDVDRVRVSKALSLESTS